MRFFIEQIALNPPNPVKTRELLEALGMTDWVHDHVVAVGSVHGTDGLRNEANLAFNYQNTRPEGKPLELEILNYTHGANWMAGRPPSVSHLGMHCTEEELEQFARKLFNEMGIKIAQAVMTESHTNPFLLETGRKYKYVIFDTRDILGVDLKFIVRREKVDEPS